MHQHRPSLTCPHCGAPQQPGASLCRACDRPLGQPPGAEPPGSYLPPRPYQWTLRTMLALLAILTLALIGASLMAQSGAWDAGIAYGLALAWITFALTHLIVWLQVRAMIRRSEDFLRSDRPLLRWTYTDEEWRELREEAWRETRGSWKLPLGCLSAIFTLVGLMVGLMVGLEDGLEEGLMGALTGGLAGGLAGGLLGGLAVGLNYVAGWRAYRQLAPARVALGPGEVYYNGCYLGHDVAGARIERITFDARPPARIILEIWAPRHRLERGFAGEIHVPRRLVPAVADVMPRLQAAMPTT